MMFEARTKRIFTAAGKTVRVTAKMSNEDFFKKHGIKVKESI